MIGLHAAGITDVGQQRKGNEDSLHVGDSVFAVADGMGGHQAGEVASALALEPIAALDGRVFGDVDEARLALGDAVVAANAAVVDAASHDDALQGMGTTLTAALFEGRRLHVAHVGDSRAYLLRAGEVVQLTRDHTFVQQLLDDGRITEDEVATHPHRSVITRAIGAREDVEVDLRTLDLRHDDAVLLCSDGLSGYVREQVIADILRSDRSPSEVVTALVDAANDAGGPDNITAVLLTVVNTRDEAAAVTTDATTPVAPEDEPTTGHDVILGGTIDDDATGPLTGGPVGSGADASGAAPGSDVDPARRAPKPGDDDDPLPADAFGPPSSSGDVTADPGELPEELATPTGARSSTLVIRPDGDAARMRPLPGPGPDESLVVDPAVRRRRIASIVVAVAIVLGLLIGGGRWLLSRSYFVGLEDDAVVIQRGIPAALGPFELSWVYEETGLTAAQLPDPQLRQVEQGIAAANATDARSIVGRLRQAANAESTDEDGLPGDDDPTGGATGDPTSGPTEPTSSTSEPSADQTAP